MNSAFTINFSFIYPENVAKVVRASGRDHLFLVGKKVMLRAILMMKKGNTSK